MVEAGEVKPNDVILEIGPGKGKLTEKLLAELSRPESGSRQRSGGKVVAVEKDRELFEFLQEKFAKQIKLCSLVLVHDDILKFEIDKTPSQPPPKWEAAPLSFGEGRGEVSYKIVANIPYNITGAIFKKFLTAEHQPTAMVLMVQHDVVKRITTPGPSSRRRGGKESVLSISVKVYGEPKMLMKVPARYFSPAPKVDSAIIAIKDISRRKFLQNGVDEEKFWQIVKKGFAHKRKKLASNLKDLVVVRSGLTTLGLEDKRAEDLTLEDWLNLAKN